MPKIKNHYRTLGVATGASAREILKARNRLLRRHHPDLNQGREDEAKERTIEIIMAAETLMHEDTRAEYDRLYRAHFGVADRRPSGAAAGVNDAGARGATGAAAGSGRGSAADGRTAEGEKQKYRVVICGYCHNKNVNPKRDYCIFCGSGIGDNPRNFSYNDDLDELRRIYYKTLFEQSGNRFELFNKDNDYYVFAGVFILIVLLKLFEKYGYIQAFLIGVGFVLFSLWLASVRARETE